MENGVLEELIISGFGGQGVMLAGKLIARTAMNSGHQVTYMPSYGAEVRGGTANCMVMISEKPIALPLVTNPQALIVLNKASLTKFAPKIQPGGLLILNSSQIPARPDRDDIEVLEIPADDIAVELGSAKCTNMVALGAYMQKRKLLDPEAATETLPEVLAKRHHKTLPVNIKAILRGAEFAMESEKS